MAFQTLGKPSTRRVDMQKCWTRSALEWLGTRSVSPLKCRKASGPLTTEADSQMVLPWAFRPSYQGRKRKKTALALSSPREGSLMWTLSLDFSSGQLEVHLALKLESQRVTGPLTIREDIPIQTHLVLS
jgi:hypothetical protein